MRYVAAFAALTIHRESLPAVTTGGYALPPHTRLKHRQLAFQLKNCRSFIEMVSGVWLGCERTSFLWVTPDERMALCELCRSCGEAWT